MKCFEVVRKVLTSTYSQIPGEEDTKDAKIGKRLREMSTVYRNKLLTDGGPDFDDPMTRFGYVFEYVPVHSHWVYELISWSDEAKELFNRSRLRATCLGGGPGSDLVGILKYMDEERLAPALFCEIVDGCMAWKRTWSDLAYELEWPSPVSTDYVIHDAGNKDTWDAPWNLHKSDLITLNFFWSEIFHLGGVAQEYLKFALDSAKPGALLLYNDNAHSRFSDPFDAISQAAGFERILAGNGDRRVYDSGEEIKEIEGFAKKFRHETKLTGQLAWRVLQKE